MCKFLKNIESGVKMNSTSITEAIQTMQNHRTVRHYEKEPIPREHIKNILLAGQGAASSNFVQAYSIIHVTDAEPKETIIQYANNKQQITECSDFFIFCADFKRLQVAGKMHHVDIKHENVENLLVATVDATLIAQNVMMAAESLGYGGCYIGGIRNNPAPLSELLQLPELVFPLFGMTLGIPAEQNDVKPRLPLEAIVHENKYDSKKYAELLPAYDETMNQYYQNRTANSKDLNWTKSMAHFLKEEKRMHMKKFLEDKGFNLK